MQAHCFRYFQAEMPEMGWWGQWAKTPVEPGVCADEERLSYCTDKVCGIIQSLFLQVIITNALALVIKFKDHWES